ncbi:TonB-dependent receptor [Novosphingobium sp.]|uniref:TonB-dependent receptor n=1 Tax=Novosphingobium sp. TaxID=1874826 RepID=UPI00260F29D9|nr:TonB-dependent receptor [Novosphingobium sp.]
MIKHSHLHKTAQLVAVMLASTMLATAAHAQNSASSNSSLPDGEIVVTAQKRNENILRTPLAASVLSQDDLTKKGVDNLEALQFATPSLSVAANGVTSSVNLRGIGLGVSSPAVVPGIAVYRDDVFQPPILSTEPLFDMAAVEVLRGPQGTFVGSSSTGGAIFYRSANPKLEETSGRIQAGFGNYNNIMVQAAVNLPISKTLAARIAFNYDDRDSFFTQRGTVATAHPGGSFAQPGDLSQKNLRLSLLWEPSDQLRVLAKFAYNKNDTDGLAHIPSRINADFTGIDYNLYYNVPNTTYDELGKRGSVQVDYETSGGVTFRSITAYNDIRVQYVDDFDSGSTVDSTFSNKVREQLFTQEFNIISPTGGAFDWVIGSYYFWDPADVAVVIQQPNGIPTRISPNTRTTKSAIAGFGQLGYKLTDAFQIQIGARYTSSKAKVTGTLSLDGLAPFTIVVPQDNRQSDDAFTGKISLNWTINPDHFAYAFAAKGYKAGGINGPAPTPNFAPESVFDYEVGLKSRWFGGAIRTEINAFYMKYKNLQLTSYIPPAGAITGGGFTGGNGIINGGAATIKGIEAQIQARAGGFGFDAGLSFIDSDLGQTLFINSQLLPGAGNVPLGPQCASGVASNPPACFNYGPATSNFSGRPLPYAPRLTLTAGIQYALELAGGASLTPRVDWSHTSTQFQSIQGGVNDFMAPRDLINAQLRFESGKWDVTAYVTNLTDQAYVVGQTYGPSWFLGRPRQYGVKIGHDF